MSGYCNINNIELQVVGVTISGHLGCPDIVIFNNVDLKVVGVTVWTLRVSIYITIIIIII